jgi:ankyrin repeat protein
VDIISLLLDKGISVNLTKTNGSTPLHIAAEFDHLEATKTLVERGACINCTNIGGNTPLMVAAQKGKLQILRYLINRRCY